MPGYHVTVYAFHHLFPWVLFTEEMKAWCRDLCSRDAQGQPSPIVRDPTGDIRGAYGTVFAMSTSQQVLWDFDLFFMAMPVDIDIVDWAVALMADMRKFTVLLHRNWPCFYVGKFPSLALHLHVDLSGPLMYRSSGADRRWAMPVYASLTMPSPLGELPDAISILRAAAYSGVQALQRSPVPWWDAPLLALDRLLSSYDELYFMRDVGTDRGECVAMYVCSRSMSRDLHSMGLYVKVELYGVPGNEPSEWWRYGSARVLGEYRMFERAPVADLYSRY